uniref:Uncharacterized protein n=1 Tax=viral metagenome TaxID=1070528 RepID=A0A6M3KCH4_9ZZZZ
MSVGAYTYGSVADIQRLIGDIVGSRTFSGSTVPTTTQVEAELDAVAAEINAHLDAHGYTVIIATADYPHAYQAATAANNYGAAARLLATIPSMGYDPEIETGQTRPQMYENRLKSFMKKIEKHQIRAGMRLHPFDNVKVGARFNADGDENKAIFTRDLHDTPGRRSLTE